MVKNIVFGIMPSKIKCYVIKGEVTPPLVLRIKVFTLLLNFHLLQVFLLLDNVKC